MIMEALFNGEFYAAEQVAPKNLEYNKENHKASDLMTELEKRLSKEEYEILEELRDHLANSQCIENEVFFKYGLAVGLVLMKEAYAVVGQYHSE